MRINNIVRSVGPTVEIPQELIDQLESKVVPDKSKPSFGYHWRAKDLWKKGKLPSVTHDVSGRKLTMKNVTIDHYVPHSKGGKTEDGNLMLATKEFNQLRGNRPLSDFVTPQQVYKYLEQWVDVIVEGFNGNKYIKELLSSFSKNNNK